MSAEAKQNGQRGYLSTPRLNQESYDSKKSLLESPVAERIATAKAAHPAGAFGLEITTGERRAAAGRVLITVVQALYKKWETTERFEKDGSNDRWKAR
jgi:hypothetical protein